MRSIESGRHSSPVQKYNTQVLNNAIIPFGTTNAHYDELLEKIGNARIVLMGEATHGTAQFYQSRIEITKQLIEKKGFNAVIMECDWPTALPANLFVKGSEQVTDPIAALNSFQRFPIWMWRNETIPPFLEWLRLYNASRLPTAKVGIYGLDLYSLNTSIKAVIDYLNMVDPNAAEKAVKRYKCINHHVDPQTYGYLVQHGVKAPCIGEVTAQIEELEAAASQYLKNGCLDGREEHFYALQNAKLVKGAEQYYRSIFMKSVSSWNVRDKYMFDTILDVEHFRAKNQQSKSKLIIWAHNSHVGDARATDMSRRHEINIGQLAREHYQEEAFIIGYSTNTGTVTAASHWDGPAEHMRVRNGLPDSYENLFSKLEHQNFLLDLRATRNHDILPPSHLQRAIGVIYLPQSERWSHYYSTHLVDQYDVILHFNATHAVKPLDLNPEWQVGFKAYHSGCE